jgi:hypothetical protein
MQAQEGLTVSDPCLALRFLKLAIVCGMHMHSMHGGLSLYM